MGAEVGEFDESPVHRVYVSAFEMAQTPVSNRDYAHFLKNTKGDAPEWWEQHDFSDPDQPVVGVNWYEAMKFCEWLSKKSGLNIRLPTEAEFEKASRGGMQEMEYPWGDTLAASGYKTARGPLVRPYPSGRNPANAYGLHDMVSNVHQWCLDGYDPNYYADSPERNPLGSDSADRRSARGASWKQENLINRCAARASLSPYFRVNDFGFRWVSAYKIDDAQG